MLDELCEWYCSGDSGNAALNASALSAVGIVTDQF